jgi:hypothetical protein
LKYTVICKIILIPGSERQSGQHWKGKKIGQITQGRTDMIKQT